MDNQPRRSVVTLLADGYANLMSRLGTGADRATAARYYTPYLDQQQIESAYRSSWLTRKVHDLVPFEMTRAGRNWQAEAAQIELLEAEEMRLAVWQKLCVALTVARLHGGSAIVLGVLGAGSPDQELVPERVAANALRYLHVVSRHQLSVPRGWVANPNDDYFGQPILWEMSSGRGERVAIHPSRIVTFHGAPLPPGAVTMDRETQFWGDPQLLAIKSAIDNAESSQAAVATLLHEMKQDVISIPNLTEQIATEGAEERLAKRIQAISTFKSMFNALLLDAGDGTEGAETWETRQLNFAQMPEILDQFIGIVAGAADIPKTRLMGASPGGMNSTGKGEQDDFNRMVRSRQGFELTGALARLDNVLIRSVLGDRPADVGYVFAPLEEANRKESAEIEKLEMESVDILTRTNHIPSVALAKALANRLVESGRWPGLDISDQELAANADETAAAAAAEAAAQAEAEAAARDPLRKAANDAKDGAI